MGHGRSSTLLPGDLSRHPPTGAEFPHVYGPINVDAVEAAYTFEPDARGIFELPGELRGKR